MSFHHAQTPINKHIGHWAHMCDTGVASALCMLRPVGVHGFIPSSGKSYLVQRIGRCGCRYPCPIARFGTTGARQQLSFVSCFGLLDMMPRRGTLLNGFFLLAKAVLVNAVLVNAPVNAPANAPVNAPVNAPALV